MSWMQREGEVGMGNALCLVPQADRGCGFLRRCVMDATLSTGPNGLLFLNVLLLVLCAAAVFAVTVAAWLDVRERRRRRALVPPCWPPPGIDPAEAYAEDAAEEVAR